MGLRHRAGLGISEVSDAIALVVSEETGSISIAFQGRFIRRLDGERLLNTLRALLFSEDQQQTQEKRGSRAKKEAKKQSEGGTQV